MRKKSVKFDSNDIQFNRTDGYSGRGPGALPVKQGNFFSNGDEGGIFKDMPLEGEAVRDDMFTGSGGNALGKKKSSKNNADNFPLW